VHYRSLQCTVLRNNDCHVSVKSPAPRSAREVMQHKPESTSEQEQQLQQRTVNNNCRNEQLVTLSAIPTHDDRVFLSLYIVCNTYYFFSRYCILHALHISICSYLRLAEFQIIKQLIMHVMLRDAKMYKLTAPSQHAGSNQLPIDSCQLSSVLSPMITNELQIV
jgi:hypothetical protein